MSATNSSPFDVGDPVMTINTADLATATPQALEPTGHELYPGGSPDPAGTHEAQERAASAEDSSDPDTGTGVDGELDVWEGRYSKRNFIGRIVFRLLASVSAGVLAYYVWGEGHVDLAILGWISLGIVALLWASLVYRMIQAHYSHYYSLTNRRLFVSTGVIHRRRDMMELLRVKDVFTRQQSLMERLLGLGTVVVVPTERELPTFYLAGVDDPKEVMDLIWHHARAERDHRSVKVDSV
jgi:membrane protein YdbS with pleckstrin-like domain